MMASHGKGFILEFLVAPRASSPCGLLSICRCYKRRRCERFYFVSLLLSVAFGLVFPRRAVDATFGGVVKLQIGVQI